MGDMQRLVVETPAFRGPAPQCRPVPTSAQMSRMSESQRRMQGGYDAKRVAAIHKSVDQIKDSLETMAKSAGEIAVLYRFSTTRGFPLPARVVAVAAIAYKALELATAPAKIVTELANIESNLTNFEKANLEQQAQVREALDKIADPIGAALDRIDDAFETRIGKNHEIAKDVLEVRDALISLSRDFNRDPSKVPRDLDKLRRTVEKLKEDVQKQLTDPEQPATKEKPDTHQDKSEPRSSLRPDTHAPTETDPGKNYNPRGPYPIAY